MKLFSLVTLMLSLIVGGTSTAYAQKQELEQLVLNIEKLDQFRQILSDMKKGYDILVQGYNTVRDLSEGNFSLHKLFLNGLLEVSPSVKKYKRVANIIEDQLQIVKEHKSAMKAISSSSIQSVEDIEHIEAVLQATIDRSLRLLADLADVLTANKFRMNDEERIKRIDGIFTAMEENLLFIRLFNNSNNIYKIQREKENADIQSLKLMYRTK